MPSDQRLAERVMVASTLWARGPVATIETPKDGTCMDVWAGSSHSTAMWLTIPGDPYEKLALEAWSSTTTFP